MTPTEMMISVGSSVVGGIILLAIQFAWRLLGNRRRVPLRRYWRENIYAPGDLGSGPPVRVDDVTCVQRGELVEATGIRLSPADQEGRTYRFTGRFTHGVLFGHYWSTDPIPNGMGALVLKYKPKTHSFEGFYLRWGSKDLTWGGEHQEIEQIPLEWLPRTRPPAIAGLLARIGIKRPKKCPQALGSSESPPPAPK